MLSYRIETTTAAAVAGAASFHFLPYQDAVVTDRVTSGFSLMTFGRNVASWSVIRRPSARSTLAPRASLLRLSLFSGVGWYRCCWRRLLSSRSKPVDHSLISWRRGSWLEVEVVVVMVLSEAAMEGTPLYVEKRFEVRLEVTCIRYRHDQPCWKRDVCRKIAVERQWMEQQDLHLGP